MDHRAVVIADPEGIIRSWSPGAEIAFGHAAAEAVGQPLGLIVPPEYAEAHWAGFHRAVRAGVAAAEGQASPFPVRHADGQVIPRLGRLTLIRSPEGQVVAAAVAFE